MALGEKRVNMSPTETLGSKSKQTPFRPICPCGTARCPRSGLGVNICLSLRAQHTPDIPWVLRELTCPALLGPSVVPKSVPDLKGHQEPYWLSWQDLELLYIGSKCGVLLQACDNAKAFSQKLYSLRQDPPEWSPGDRMYFLEGGLSPQHRGHYTSKFSSCSLCHTSYLSLEITGQFLSAISSSTKQRWLLVVF